MRHEPAKLLNERWFIPEGALQILFGCLLWFSVPLSVWLVSGWMGLVLYWQAEFSAVVALERTAWKQQRTGQA